MKRMLLSINVALAALLPLTGCWDRRELNELAISLALAIDRIDDRYLVTVQVVQPAEVASQKGGGQTTPVTVYRSEGVTLFEAIRKMTTFSPRKIYAAHLRVAVFGEALAREGIGDSLDLLSRDYEFRTDFYLLVSKGMTAERTLNVLTPLDKIPASKLFNSIQTSSKAWAPSVTATLDEFLEDIEGDGHNPVLSGIRVVGNAAKGDSKDNLNDVRPPARLRNAGLAVFRKDRLVGWMNEMESKGYSYISNNVKSTVGHIPCPEGGKAAVEVIHSEAKLKGDVKDGRANLAVELSVEQNVGEVQCRIDLTRSESIRELEREAENTLTGILLKAINVAQNKYKSDIFGFGEAVHRSHPSAWKSMKDDWDNLFADSYVDVRVKVKIKRTGTIGNSYKERKE